MSGLARGVLRIPKYQVYFCSDTNIPKFGDPDTKYPKLKTQQDTKYP